MLHTSWLEQYKALGFFNVTLCIEDVLKYPSAESL